MLVSKQDIKKILLAWQAGDMTAAQVQDWAEHHYFPGRYEFEDDNTQEILSALDGLNVELYTSEDVPAFLHILEQNLTAEQSAAQVTAHYKTIDKAKRKVDLASDPHYAAVIAHES